jgi:hypothetical protein
MRFNSLSTKKQNSQKKRNVITFKNIKINFGTEAIIVKKQFRFELQYITIIKKYLKNLLKYNLSRNINKKKI